MELTTHGIAQHHRRALAIEGPLVITVVEQHRMGAGNRPLLGVVHGKGNFRRNRQMPLVGVPLPIPHPGANFAIGLIGGSRIRVIVGRNIPALRWHLTDTVVAIFDVFPELVSIGSIGQDSAYAYDCDSAVRSVCHHIASTANVNLVSGRFGA